MIKKLDKLYPGRGEEVHGKVKELIRDFRKRNPGMPGKRGFTEKDAILICYPDHVREEREPKLRTLRKFLNEFAREFSMVHVLPHYPEAGDEGFSVKDYFSVREDLGTWKDVWGLSKDFGLMLDLVLNHMSDRSEWFKRFLARDVRMKDFFISFDKEPDTSKVFRPRTDPLLTPYRFSDGSERLVWTTFPLSQVDLNYANPEVLIEIIRALLLCAENGARAIRLDAIAYVWKKLGTSCFNLPEAHILVEVFRDVLEEAAPGTLLVTETVIDHRENTSYLGDCKARMAYHFVLEPLLYLTFLKGDSSKMTEYLRGMHVPDGKECAYLNLSVSHDGIHAVPASGILSEEDFMTLEKDCRKKGCGVMMRTVPGKDSEYYEFNTTYLDAIGSPGAFLASQAVMLGLPGVPLVYFNSYFGCRNWLEGIKEVGYPRAANRQRFEYKEIAGRLRDKGTESGSVLRRYSRMLRARTAEPLFAPSAGFAALDVGPDAVAFRRYRGDGSLLAIANVTGKELRVSVPGGSGKATDILTGKELDLGGPLPLKPYEYLWMKQGRSTI